MCELLGLNFNQPVNCSLSFRKFQKRGDCNPDGWGIAWYEGEAWKIIKEPISATSSSLADSLRDNQSLMSKIFIGHVRRKSSGSVSYQNTHPFSCKFRSREVVLAHNGTIDHVIEKARLKFHPIGETDSEELLCAFLTELSDQDIDFTNFEKIEAILKEFNEYGTMNLIFSDSEHLFCYHDKHGDTSLRTVERHAPFGKVKLKDEVWEVDLAGEKHADQRGFVIATNSLTNEEWKDIQPGSLIVFKDGVCIYGLLVD